MWPNDLFGIATEKSFCLFVVVEAMPFAIVTFHKNKTVAATSFDESSSFDMRCPNDAGL